MSRHLAISDTCPKILGVNLTEMRPISRTLNQIIRFGAVGIVTLSTNFVVTVVAREVVGLAVEASYLCGFFVVLVISFFLCRQAVFNSAAGHRIRQFILFVASSVFFRGMEFLATVGLYKLIGTHYILALLAVQVGSFFIKFFYYRDTVFSNTCNPST